MIDVRGVAHADLVTLGIRWLKYRRRCTVVFSEMVCGEVADAVGWCGARSILLECKVSRADFFANEKKRHGRGIGEERWFLTRIGLVKAEEVPATWGLLEWDGEHFRQTVKAEKRNDYARQHEIDLLISALRRIRPSPEGTSVKVYTTETKNTAQAHIVLAGGQKEGAGK